MRHLAHCLILLMAPLTVQATEAAGGSQREGCTYAVGDERGSEATSSGNAVNGAPGPAGKSGAVHNAGDDDLMPRMRAPKWHRYLPGMFR